MVPARAASNGRVALRWSMAAKIGAAIAVWRGVRSKRFGKQALALAAFDASAAGLVAARPAQGRLGLVPDEPRRALVLAGGGIRVAWQAGVVQALDEAGLTFVHGDGTSGGIFTLGMLMSGVRPNELGRRWRTLRVRRFISLAPASQLRPSPDELGGLRRSRRSPQRRPPASRRRRCRDPRTSRHDRHVQRRRLRQQAVRCDSPRRDRSRPDDRGRVTSDLPPGRAERRSDMDRRCLDQGRQPARGRAPGLHGAVADLVHREHAAVGERSARAIRAHDRAVGQRFAVRRARSDRRHQRASREG